MDNAREQVTELTREMEALTAGLKTKSDKIRRLGQAGYTRQQIADFLDIRYQHVRNVLVEEERRPKSATGATSGIVAGESKTMEPRTPRSPHRACRVDIGPGGEVVLPNHIMDAAGTGPGRYLLARFDDDEIKLVTPEATTRKVHAIMRRYVPEGVSLVDELLKERRREAQRELREAGVESSDD